MEGAGLILARDALLHSAALVRITRCAHARGTESCTVRVSPLFLLLFAFFFSFFSIICVSKFEGSRNVR